VSSRFNLYDLSALPTATVSATATGTTGQILVGWVDSTSRFTQSYNVYRAISSTASSNTCPTFPDQSATSTVAGTTGSYSLVTTVNDHTGTTSDGFVYQYNDNGLTNGTAYCYAVTSLSDGDQSNAAYPPTNFAFSQVTPSTTTTTTTTQTAPTILDVRAITDTTTPGIVSVDDVHRFIFSAPVTNAISGSYTYKDGSGTIGTINCGSNATCTMNATTQTITTGLAGAGSNTTTTYAANQILYVTLLASGSSGTPLYPVTLIATNFTGNPNGAVQQPPAGDTIIERSPCPQSGASVVQPSGTATPC